MSNWMARLGIAAAAAVGVLGLSASASAQYSQGYRFLEAVKKREGSTVEQMLDQPGTTVVNTRDVSSGESALHIVTAQRDLTWVTYLVSKGANVNLRTNRGSTPLQIAVSTGFTEAVELLIRKGARVDEPDGTGETPLITAVHRRDTGMMRMLLKAGASPDRADNSGRTARDYAALDGKGSALLAEIENNAKTKEAAGVPSQTRGSYGPSF